MRNFISRVFAIAAVLTSLVGFVPTVSAQSFGRAEPSFAPPGGIVGAVPNISALGSNPVRIVNGVPVGAAPVASPVMMQPVRVNQPFVVRPNIVPTAVPLNLGGGVPVFSGQAHCKGFARASDGSLVATSGGGFESMIIGADCDELIQQTLRAGHGIVFSASVLFEGSSDTITLSAKRALKMTAEAINASGGIYEVAGYASREGDRIANDYLSWRRAKAASYYLIRHGVETPHLNIVGKGETTIFGPELAVNRRVVVRRKA